MSDFLFSFFFFILFDTFSFFLSPSFSTSTLNVRVFCFFNSCFYLQDSFLIILFYYFFSSSLFSSGLLNCNCYFSSFIITFMVIVMLIILVLIQYFFINQSESYFFNHEISQTVEDITVQVTIGAMNGGSVHDPVFFIYYSFFFPLFFLFIFFFLFFSFFLFLFFLSNFFLFILGQYQQCLQDWGKIAVRNFKNG